MVAAGSETGVRIARHNTRRICRHAPEERADPEGSPPREQEPGAQPGMHTRSAGGRDGNPLSQTENAKASIYIP